ncbi:DNA-directed RNA polymerase subunit beta [Candidatus Gracilibacteria bacterium]|nr:DNA-directed RNA polymerase subunit beta [Candidatus Gracilibacteria bacterium]NUJ99369.1 DNA-directed RNA polymerase subunit beta [Candidatus Gracilibacteria bacterium]
MPTKKTSSDVGSLYDIKGRHYFTDDKSVAGIPELLEVQLDSYKDFLSSGIDKTFKESFPISDFSGEKIDIYYKGFSLEEPKFDPESCKRKNLNYEASLKVRLEMLNKESGEIKEQDVYMGGIPLMTNTATFVINGIERVIVNQIIRSTGVFFNLSETGHTLKIIPAKGSWFEIDIEKRGIINVKIDKKRKVPISVILRAFGLESNAEILNEFKDLGDDIIATYISPTIEKDKTNNRLEALHTLYKLLRPGDLATDERVEDLFQATFFDEKRFDLGDIARMKMSTKMGIKTKYDDEKGMFLSLEDIVKSLKYYINIVTRVNGYSLDDIDHLENRRVRSVGELVIEKLKVGITRMERIAKDRMTIVNLDDATPGTFINSRPIIAILKEFFASSQLSQFMDQSNPLSELAHKRRVSALGPGGLTRERASFEVRDVHPTQYGRICPIATPEGPNIGLVLHLATYARVDKFGFILTPFRKVDHIIANDGKSAINKIALGDIVGKDGKVIVKDKEYITEKQAEELKKQISDKTLNVRGFLSKDYDYFDAYQERKLVIAEANTKTDEFGNFLSTRLSARANTEPTIAYIKEITHIDISPKQITSVETSLIPFLEHDDATRAEMGSNMMRQAVPLIRPDAPTVGTGMERIVGEGSGYVIKAREDGEVLGVDAKHITVLYSSGEKMLYELKTFKRSNHDMIVHQKPLVSSGQKIQAGDVLCDGHSIENGELALGKNLVVAYMPWKGYNFEDAIIISSKVVEKDYYTSIHIKEYSIDVRETKLGPEQTTDDIPNVSISKLKDLDIDGIIRVGAYVEGGDILVGKITPKGEQELSPEERLLRAIFGDKSKDVKDSSLRLPSGQGGKVIDVETLKRENGDNLPTGVFKQIKVYVAQTRKMEVGDKMAGRHGNKGIVSRVVPIEDMPFMEDGTPVDIILNPLGVVSRMNIGQVLEAHLGIAAKKLGIKVATPVLNGVPLDTITELMLKAGLPADGKVQLFNGETGEPFKEKTMVGVKYMLKLHHLVEDKIHARSVGPYSMVTQQPLGGKAQNGGQRFGEMEVWALEAYAASNILQEMITIKSDDVAGRTQAYEAIVKNMPIKKPNIPESFNVLIKELQSIGLDVELLDREELSTREKEIQERYDKIIEIENKILSQDLQKKEEE